ncbi:MAG: hypothetical protein QOE58_2916 [Actinomycetota bacterium]|nr:hypothetical protein [Actinomycetota bacterium]
MRQGQQKPSSTLSLAVAGVTLAAAMLAGCGHANAGSGTTPPAQADTLAAAAPLTLTPDIRACAEVQALMGHITVDTARWSPNLNPFDRTVSARIGQLSKNLDKQVPQAKSQHIKAVVHSNAQAFAAVAAAMTAKNTTSVSRAISGTKVAYRQLKAVCQLKLGSGG